jgi:hypothetical protein
MALKPRDIALRAASAVVLAPAAVLAYIETHGLYGAGTRETNGGGQGADPQPCL